MEMNTKERWKALFRKQFPNGILYPAGQAFDTRDLPRPLADSRQLKKIPPFFAGLWKTT